jgi:CheY-like chemotaxis protein
MMLGGQGFEVETAENGLEAVNKKSIGGVKGKGYDVIILDLDMPIMNGFEAC